MASVKCGRELVNIEFLRN